MARDAPVVVGKEQPQNDGSSCKSALCVADELKFLLQDGGLATASSSHNLELPAWFDWDKFRRGQQYFHKNYFALFVAKLCGLLTILTIPSIVRVLMMTRQSSEPVTAFRRYVVTLTHMLEWYDGDLLEPTSGAHKSLMEVRKRHCTAARKARKAGFGPISQLDMVLTQFAFMGFGLLVPEKLGLSGSPEEQEGFIHFWRTVGHLLGIEDRFNICKGNLPETKQLCQTILEEIFVPALKKPADGFEQMSRSLLEGMWAMVPYLDYDAFLAFTMRLAGVEVTEDKSKTLPFTSKVLLAYQIFVHELVLMNRFLAWLVRPVLNFLMWLSVFITQRLPILAYVQFGRSHVY
jgi:hypothetical protein